eukprot:TRINITY_DN8753_c0_g1_i1.p1 TRINITY_DN8753_c0_g1~~TRINITY_DN8753_c0_g1_i1.p1  ORF type:complete len:328 (-),score=48.35 TRINITY_DN8753_c0_g1_i1:62-1045(-)
MTTTQVSTFDSQHQDMIHDAQMDYYGKRLATCSSDKVIKIFDCSVKDKPPKWLTDLNGHEGPVWQLAWVPYPKWGQILASCSYDRKVIVWKEERANQWVKLYEYNNHQLSVNSISWAPQEYGLMLACGSSDGYISVLKWKATSGNEWTVHKFPAHELGVNSVSWAPVSPALIAPAVAANQQVAATGATSNAAANTVLPPPQLASGSCDNTVKIWSLDLNEWKNPEPVHHIKDHADWVRDVAWAPNIGLPYSTLASCSQDGTVVISTLQDSKWSSKSLEKFNGAVWRVSWSVTGNILAVSTGDSVTLWKETLDVWKCISTVGENTENK